jgi:hypothetical protein
MLLAACGDCGLSVPGLVTSGMGHIHDHGMALGLCTHTTHVVAVGLWGVSWAGARGSGVWHAIAIAAGGAMGAFPLQRHKCKRAERGPGGDQCAANSCAANSWWGLRRSHAQQRLPLAPAPGCSLVLAPLPRMQVPPLLSAALHRPTAAGSSRRCCSRLWPLHSSTHTLPGGSHARMHAAGPGLRRGCCSLHRLIAPLLPR